MSIVLNQTPGTYESVHGDLLFTAYESVKAIDPVTYPNYKYVCDVYVNGTLVSTLLSFPDPEYARGIFNIGATVRNYITLQFNPTTGLRAQEFSNPDFSIDVQCKFGEEYDGVRYSNLTTDSTRTYYNHYNGLMYGDNTILDSYLDLVATNRPAQTSIDINTANVYVPYFASSSGSTVALQVKSYDYGNSLIATNSQNITPTYSKSLQQYNVSPAAINAVWSNMINAGVKYYTVKFGGASLLQFNLADNCKYTTYTLHFLNKYGGFDSCDFRYVSRKTLSIEKKNFGRLPYVIKNDGTIGYNTPNNVVYGSKEVYASQYTQTLKLTSDWLNNSEYEWLADLMLSPLIYIQWGAYLVPVSIDTKSYEVKKVENDRLTIIQPVISFSDRLNTQFR